MDAKDIRVSTKLPTHERPRSYTRGHQRPSTKRHTRESKKAYVYAQKQICIFYPSKWRVKQELHRLPSLKNDKIGRWISFLHDHYKYSLLDDILFCSVMLQPLTGYTILAPLDTNGP